VILFKFVDEITHFSLMLKHININRSKVNLNNCLVEVLWAELLLLACCNLLLNHIPDCKFKAELIVILLECLWQLVDN